MFLVAALQGHLRTLRFRKAVRLVRRVLFISDMSTADNMSLRLKLQVWAAIWLDKLRVVCFNSKTFNLVAQAQ